MFQILSRSFGQKFGRKEFRMSYGDTIISQVKGKNNKECLIFVLLSVCKLEN